MIIEATRRRGDGERGRCGGVVAPSPRLPVPPSLIAGIPVANLSEAEAVEVIDKMISEGGSHYGAVVNAAKLVAANRDEKLKRALLDADLVTADGMSVVWASLLLGQELKERVTGIDLFQRLVEHAAHRGIAVYFLGAREDSVRGVVQLFANRYPALRIAGFHNGYFDSSESQSLSEAIRLSGAALLFVAMGSPKQEHWIASNVALTGVGFALGVGGSFDHLSGLARRAPRWMQRAGLEWFHRLAQEPRRLWRRYLIGNSAFIWLVIRQRLRGRRPDRQPETR
ncbi:MAG TPA: WecB/TagA/CpsF family glycosyltransferase [Blastocatellia bacterium]|nr:WecB/TagA/CpsF family glycosyltransferase [Blastocatellia bacterium]